MVPVHIVVLEQDRMHAVLIPQIHRMTVAFLGNDQLCPWPSGSVTGTIVAGIMAPSAVRIFSVAAATHAVFFLDGFGIQIST